MGLAVSLTRKRTTRRVPRPSVTLPASLLLLAYHRGPLSALMKDCEWRQVGYDDGAHERVTGISQLRACGGPKLSIQDFLRRLVANRMRSS